MTNEEKARELRPICIVYSDEAQEKYDCNMAERLAALEMAEWKDQQFKEYLEKKTEPYIRTNASPQGTYQEGLEDGYTSAINEIINELFGGE